MKATELRKQTKDELVKRLQEKKSELNALRFDIRIGQELNYSTAGKLRKEIARINTLLTAGVFAEEKAEKASESTKKDSKKAVKSDKITKSKAKK